VDCQRKKEAAQHQDICQHPLTGNCHELVFKTDPCGRSEGCLFSNAIGESAQAVVTLLLWTAIVLYDVGTLSLFK
jgi:hypothetical protein